MYRQLRVSIFSLIIAVGIIPINAQTIKQDTLKARTYLTLADSLYHIAKYHNADSYYVKATHLYKSHQLWKGYLTTQNAHADILTKQWKYKEALRLLEELLKLGKLHLGAQAPEVADTHHHIATLHCRLGRGKQALEHYQTALKIKRYNYGEQHPKIADTYQGLGDLYKVFINFDKALEFYQKALAIRQQELGEYHLKTADAYHATGSMLSSIQHYKRAMKYYQKALKIRQIHFKEQHPLVAESYYRIGNVYRSWNQPKPALAYYQKCIKIYQNYFEKTPISTNTILYEGYVLTLNALLYVTSLTEPNHDKVLKKYLVTLDSLITKFGEKHPLIVSQYMQFGECYGRYQNHTNFKYYFEKAKTLSKELGDIEKYLKCLINLSWYYGDGVGNTDISLALQSLKSALETSLYYNGEYHFYTSEAYNGLGELYGAMGNYEMSLNYLFKALELRKTVLSEKRRTARVGVSYNNISDVYFEFGNYKKFLEFEQKALAILKDDEYHSCYVYDHLATYYEKIGDLNNALDYLTRSLHFRLGEGLMDSSNSHKKFLVCSNFVNLGRLYLKKGDTQKGFYHLQQALKGYQSVLKEENHLTARIYQIYGDYYDAHNQTTKSLVYYQKALHSNDSLTSPINILDNPQLTHYHHPQILLQTLQSKAQTLPKLKPSELGVEDPLALSLETYRVVDTLIGQMRHKTPYQKDKLILAETSTQVYQNALEIALQLYHRDKEPVYLEHAFYFSEQSKASVLLGAQADQKARQFIKIPDNFSKFEKKLNTDKAHFTQQLGRDNDSIKRYYYQKQLFTVNIRLDSLRDVIETQYPNYTQRKKEIKIIKINEVQDHLSSNELLLEYLWGENTLYTLAMTKEDIQVHKVAIDSSLAKAPKTLMNHFLGWGNTFDDPKRKADPVQLQDYINTANYLYQKILAPVLEQRQGIQQLIIIPDGPLHSIPFDALLTKRVTKDNLPQSYHRLPYLIKDYALRYGFSATLLFQETQKKSDKDVQKLFAGFAPTYEDSKLYVQSDQDALFRAQEERTLRALYTQRGNLQPLIYNQPEVQQIQKTLGGDAIIGMQATKAAFKAKASQYRILHIAAHGFANDSLPAYSGIAFANDPYKTDKEQDNFLQSHELYDMELNAELVVLSACNTGVGKWRKGEGTMSLGRAFRYAGCSNILMSQWRINDEKTAQIMEFFYNGLKKGEGKDDALRKAKLQFLKENPTGHPSQWAGFSLWGDSAPIETTTKSYTKLTITLLLIVIGLIGLYWFLAQKNSAQIK